MEHIKSSVTGLIILSIAGIICVALQKLFPSVSNQKWWLKDSRLNFYYWLINNFIATLFATLLVSTVLILTSLIYPNVLKRLDNISSGSDSVLSFIIAIIAIDFVGYWLHRLFHGRKLWKFHAIHHSPVELDWLSSARFHPLETMIVVATTYVLIIIAGISLKTIGLAFAVRAAYGFVVHANLRWHYGPFGYAIASPYFHRWHHTCEKAGLDKNFAGLFSVWDFIFGTAYFPKPKQPHNFGIGHSPGENIWQQLIYPFRNR